MKARKIIRKQPERLPLGSGSTNKETTSKPDIQALVLLAYDLFPGYGVFGPRPPMRWALEINGRLKRLCLFLDAGEENDYVFPRPHLFGRNGREIPLVDIVEAVHRSSGSGRRNDTQAYDALLASQPVKSERGLRPELTIMFSSMPLLSRIEIANRPGPFGARNRNLCLSGYYGRRLVLSHRIMSPTNMIEDLLRLHDDLNLDLPAEFHDGTARVETRKRHCENVRRAILERIDQDRFPWSALRLAQLLPLYDEAVELTTFNLRITAEVIAQALPKRLSIGTVTFSPLAKLMSSPDRIEEVLAELNRRMTGKLDRSTKIIASKHAIQEPALIQRRDGYLAALDAAFPALSACGVTPMLCYGSLLGAVREQAFLEHDDDVDLLYFDGSTSREEMLARREDLIRRLAAHGFEADSPRTKGTINFHIRNVDGKLDLFPSWQEGQNLHVMLNYPIYHPVPATMILPRSEVRLHDRLYPAPADPIGFLARRYGSSWATPDPYHEWPWPMRGAS